MEIRLRKLQSGGKNVVFGLVLFESYLSSTALPTCTGNIHGFKNMWKSRKAVSEFALSCKGDRRAQASCKWNSITSFCPTYKKRGSEENLVEKQDCLGHSLGGKEKQNPSNKH